MNQTELTLHLLEFFLAETQQIPRGKYPNLTKLDLPRDPRAQREILDALLTTRDPRPLPAEVQTELEALLKAETQAKQVVEVSELPRLAQVYPGLKGSLAAASLWQGDITRLRADAIVNAANSQLLGCFTPGHRCIDNVIHAAAGPQLRMDCAKIMDLQAHLEPTGSAQITPAYNLPSSYVIHTVGPIVGGATPTANDAQLLASCYQSCLDLAQQQGNISSLVFCSISTGVFAYPIAAATEVALDTVAQWLEQHADTSLQVIFNTFSDRDTQVYQAALQERAKR